MRDERQGGGHVDLLLVSEELHVGEPRALDDEPAAGEGHRQGILEVGVAHTLLVRLHAALVLATHTRGKASLVEVVRDTATVTAAMHQHSK